MFAVDLKDVVIVELREDVDPAALDDLLLLHRFADEVANGADILLHRAPHGLVFVGVDHRADAFVGEDLGEQGPHRSGRR